MRNWICCGVLTLCLGLSFESTAFAQVKIEGTFTTQKICPANKRLISDNPGDVMTIIGESYTVVGKNKSTASHYLIVVPGAEVTERRWIDIECGTAVVTVVVSTDSDTTSAQPIEVDSIENVLAASWQPTFCATERGKTKVECQTQTANRPDATQFSIHGLWPDDLNDTNIFPCYCDNGPAISCKRSLPSVSSLAISTPIKDKLDVLMPGTQSGLELHEWSKHGSCYEDFNSGADVGSDADEYFLDTIAMIEQLNASAVGSLFSTRLGQEVTFVELQEAFEKSFGEGAGNRVVMNCNELTV